MDLVEARKKAKELAEKKQQETVEIKPSQIETPESQEPVREKQETKAKKEEPKAKSKEAKDQRPKRKDKAEKAGAKSGKLEAKSEKRTEKEEPVARKEKREELPAKPETDTEVAKAQNELKPMEQKEEAFVDMSFGEDLPDVRTEDKEITLLETGAEKMAEKKKPGEEAKQAVVAELAKPAQAPNPVETEASKEVTLEEDAEKDFYELVVEDLVQYGYGSIDKEKDLIELLSFRLGSEIYAVSLVKIQQIIKPRPITLVPGAPHYLLGIISLRGMIIPVFDLRRRLGLAPAQPGRQSRIIIIKARENVLTGLYVDQVLEVARISESSIEAPHAIFSAGSGGMEGEFLEGIARHKNQMLIILNIEQVIFGKVDEGKALER